MEQLIGLALIVIGLGGLYAFFRGYRQGRTGRMTDAQFREYFTPPRPPSDKFERVNAARARRGLRALTTTEYIRASAAHNYDNTLLPLYDYLVYGCLMFDDAGNRVTSDDARCASCLTSPTGDITPGMRVSGSVEGIITEVYTGDNNDLGGIVKPTQDTGMTFHHNYIDTHTGDAPTHTIPGCGVDIHTGSVGSVSPPTDTNIGGGFDAGTN